MSNISDLRFDDKNMNGSIYTAYPVQRVEDGKIYNSILDASLELGCKPDSIRRAICEQHKSFGYMWEYYCMPIEGEEWRPIIDAPIYEISSAGRIRKTKGHRLLRPHLMNSNYYRIELNYGGRIWRPTIHRLVAITFIPNPHNKPDVNHLDGNKHNNNVTNLEWCTKSENIRHAFRTGLKHSPPGKKVKCVETGVVYDSLHAAAKSVEGNLSNLSAHLHRKARHSSFMGKHWRFV